MSNLIQIKRGFLHKLASSIIVLIIYAILSWNAFVFNPEFGEPYHGLHVFGLITYCILNIPLVIFMVMYLVYSFFYSHKKTFGQWLEDTK